MVFILQFCTLSSTLLTFGSESSQGCMISSVTISFSIIIVKCLWMHLNQLLLFIYWFNTLLYKMIRMVQKSWVGKKHLMLSGVSPI